MKTGLPTTIDDQYGSHPLTSVIIHWPAGDVTYTDEVIVIGNLSSSVKIGQVGAVSGINVTLDDTNGNLKSKYDSSQIAGVEATVRQSYMDDAVNGTLFKGKISSNINWSEGQRQLSFNIESEIDSKLLPWPHVFGRVRYVPGRQDNPPLFGLTKDLLLGAGLSGVSNPATAEIENGSEFPQSIQMVVAIEFLQAQRPFFATRATTRMLVRGTFSGDTLTVDTWDFPIIAAQSVAARVADSDFWNPRVLWVSDGSKDYVGTFFDISGMNLNLCYRQEGTKLWFRKDWTSSSTGAQLALNNTYTITEVTRGVTARSGKSYSEGLEVAVADSWYVSEGARVYDLDQIESEYIVNQVASDAVVEVLAWRKPDPDSDAILQKVPSSYFTVSLTGPTTITFPQPLEFNEREGWEEDRGIFAAVRSTLSNNTATAVKWVLDNHTDVDTDATTFTSVATDVDGIDSNFATLTDRDALELSNQMAWQARCALFESQGIMKIKYLGKVPDAVYNYDATKVEYASLNAGLSEDSDLVTRLIINWQNNYSKEEPNELIYEENINAFGLKEQEEDIFIYTYEPNVQHTVNFWGKRFANTWRTVKVAGFHDAMILDPFDAASVAVSEFSATSIKGEVSELNMDFNSMTISASIMLASRPTDGMVQEDSFWVQDAAPGATPDPTTGLSLSDFDIPKWPIIIETDNPQEITLTVRTTVNVSKVKRGESFTVEVTILDQSGNIFTANDTFDLNLISSDGSDVLSASSINVTNGTGSASVTVTGGTTAATFTILADNANEVYTFEASSQVDVDIIGEAIFDSFPSVVVRGQPFTVTIINGFPTTVYDLTLNIGTTDTLSPLTVTTDSGGSASIDLTIDGSDEQRATFTIDLSRSSYTHTSPLATLVKLIQFTSLAAVGEIWAKNAAGDWTIEIPGEPVEDTGIWHPTAISFEIESDSGLDIVLQRNVSTDPPGIKNPDDIEILFKIKDGGVNNAKVGDVSFGKLTAEGETIADNQFLQWDATAGKFVAATVSISLALNDLTDVDTAAKAQDTALYWDAATSGWLAAPAILRKSGVWNVTGGPVHVFDESLILYGGTPSAKAALSTGEGIAIAYSATEAVAWRKSASTVDIADGTIGGALASVLSYHYSSTPANRKFDFKTKLDLQGTSPTEGQAIVADADGKPVWGNGLPDGTAIHNYLKWDGTKWVQVGTIELKICVAGVEKTYRVPGEDIT